MSINKDFHCFLCNKILYINQDYSAIKTKFNIKQLKPDTKYQSIKLICKNTDHNQFIKDYIYKSKDVPYHKFICHYKNNELFAMIIIIDNYYVVFYFDQRNKHRLVIGSYKTKFKKVFDDFIDINIDLQSILNFIKTQEAFD